MGAASASDLYKESVLSTDLVASDLFKPAFQICTDLQAQRAWAPERARICWAPSSKEDASARARAERLESLETDRESWRGRQWRLET